MDAAALAMHSLEDRVVVVTGAGRGVGAGIATHLGRCGARIVAADYRQERLESIVSSLRSLDVDVVDVLCDVREEASIHEMVASALDRFGRIDALVNNAQTFRPKAAVADIDADDFDVFLDSGPKGTLWAMQAVYPHFRERAWGRVVNFASAMGIIGGAGFGAYNASKEAIRAITRTAAREWAPDGIVVNAVAPAAASHRVGAGDDPEYRRFAEGRPMGRDGDAETDIGPLVAFLCSDACRFVTGHTFMADGGAFMWS